MLRHSRNDEWFGGNDAAGSTVVARQRPAIKAVKYNAPLTDLSFPDAESSETASDSISEPAKIADAGRGVSANG